MPGPAFPQAPLGGSKMDSSVCRFSLSDVRSHSKPHHRAPNAFIFLYLPINTGESYIYKGPFYQVTLPQQVNRPHPLYGGGGATY
jgi:hypothetical protein